jgi:hypothetical protein
MTRPSLPILLAAAIAVAAGCGSDDDAEPAATRSAAATPARANATYGTYLRRVSKRDLARTGDHREEYGPNQELPPVGEYRLVIARGAAQDVLKTTGPDGFTIAMDVTAADASLELTSYVDPAAAAYCGPEVTVAATYDYTPDGATLALKPASSDPCADRDSVLTGTWRKQ